MKTINQIYNLVIENILLESLKDDAIKKYGSSNEVELYVNKFWNDIRHREKDINKKDINYWLKKSFNEFKQYIDTFKSGKEKITDSKKNVEKIYEDENWLLIRPLTKDAAIFYGKNTTWCVSAINSPNKFDEYNNAGPLYFLINKKDEDEKYGLFFSSGEYVNASNDKIEREFLLYIPEYIIEKILNLAHENIKENIIYVLEDLHLDNNKWLTKYSKEKNIIDNTSELLNQVEKNTTIEKIDDLIKKGAKITYNDNQLLKRIISSKQNELLKHLVEKYKVDITFNNNALLKIAINRDNIEAVKYLLDHGADINTIYKSDAINDVVNNPLYIAIYNTNIDILKLLFEYPNLKYDDNMLLSLIDYSIFANIDLSNSVYRYIDIFKFLYSKLTPSFKEDLSKNINKFLDNIFKEAIFNNLTELIVLISDINPEYLIINMDKIGRMDDDAKEIIKQYADNNPKISNEPVKQS